MADLKAIFNAIGFLKSETKTYLAGLELGPATVIDLSKKTGLSRQATYQAIKLLSERGILSSMQQGKKTYYVAESPKKLLSYAKRYEANVKERLKELEEAVPELSLLVGGEKPVVRLFEGKEGSRAILEDIALSKPKEVWEIGDLVAFRKVFPPEEMMPLAEKLKQLGIRYRGIYSGEARSVVHLLIVEMSAPIPCLSPAVRDPALHCSTTHYLIFLNFQWYIF